ncbi:hypothetical protein Tco_0869443 [Tanacetum coccineum]
MVAYLLKPEGSEDFQQIVDFLNTSHIKFAFTKNPTIYTSLIQQFWQTASTSTLEDREVEITATIDGQLKTITEASLRRHLKLEDADGISLLPNTEIFEQFALIGYTSKLKLTFQKGHFSPQWRFLIHTILHCLSPKKTAWEQFSSNIATAIICLATNRTFNFSKVIFEGMVKKFGHMLVQGPIQQGEGSTVPVESHHTPITTPSTSQPPLSSPSRVPTPPYDSPLPGGHTPRSDEGSMTLNELTVLCTQLSTKVASLEQDLKQTKKVYVQDKGTSWIQEDAEIQGRTSADTEILLDQEEHTELVEDLGSGEKGEKEISTANISVSTASATPKVSTAAENLKKAKKQLEQERLGHEEAIRLQEQINEEERQRIARDAEIAKQLQEEFDRARQEQEVVAEADQAHDIDWSDPAVLRYHALQNRSFSIAEIEKEVMKRPGFDFPQKSIKKNDKIKASGFVQKRPAEEEKEKKNNDSQQPHEMLDDFDRQDVMDLHRLVQERYDTTSPERYDLLLWGDLKILFEPNEEDEIWKNQQEYNLISWRLFDSCGIHILRMHTGIAIHMLIDKKYPLTQEMLSRMLNRRLEVDQQSEMAFKLLRFIRSCADIVAFACVIKIWLLKTCLRSEGYTYPSICVVIGSAGYAYPSMDQKGMPTLVCVRSCPNLVLQLIMPPRMRTRSAGRPISESRGGGTGERVGRVGRGRGPRGGNDERVDELNGQGNGQGLGANGNVKGVNGNVEGVNGV